MLSDLKQALYETVSKNVPESRVMISYSGGVDSSLLAKICQDLGKQVLLTTIGFPDSHDITFSEKIASVMGIQHKTFEIKYQDFLNDLGLVRSVIKCDNTSHIENCIAYFYICKLANELGMKTVLSANGCDELFCGYDEYRRAYIGGWAAVMTLMDQKILNELRLVAEIAIVASQFGVEVKQPFLADKFIEFAKTIPIDNKIKGPDDMTRKHILRQVALLIGVPEESAKKPKKALQYGTEIHKNFRKSVIDE